MYGGVGVGDWGGGGGGGGGILAEGLYLPYFQPDHYYQDMHMAQAERRQHKNISIVKE